jgi:hypothetical protein
LATFSGDQAGNFFPALFCCFVVRTVLPIVNDEALLRMLGMPIQIQISSIPIVEEFDKSNLEFTNSPHIFKRINEFYGHSDFPPKTFVKNRRKSTCRSVESQRLHTHKKRLLASVY